MGLCKKVNEIKDRLKFLIYLNKKYIFEFSFNFFLYLLNFFLIFKNQVYF